MITRLWNHMGCIQGCRALADTIAGPLSISLERWLQSGEINKNANTTAILMKGKMEHPGNYWPISLNSFPRKIMELVFLEAMSKHTGNRKVAGKASWMLIAWMDLTTFHL